MGSTRDVLEAFVKLGPNSQWQVLITAWRQERQEVIEQLLQAGDKSEYERAVLVGRARAIGEILELAETAPKALREFGTH